MNILPQTPQQRLSFVKECILQACERSNRDISEVTLIGVSKGHSFDHIRPYLELEINDLGESYLQEAELKIPLLQEAKNNLTKHFIGHLQSNKAKKVLELFDYIHSVDSLKLAKELQKRASQLLKTDQNKFSSYPVFIEVNLSGDSNKSGCKTHELLPIVEFITHQASHLKAIGIMTISPLEMVNEQELHDFYRKTSDLSIQIQENYPDCKELSMGMSDDFTIAIEEGSTYIRIGTLLFGPRT